MNISEKIRLVREQRGFSQAQLADKLGVARTTVTAWESATVAPSLAMLMQLCDYFNVSADYLLGRDKRSVVDVSSLSDEESETIKRLVEQFSRYHA